jgi:hypothetical protein
MTTDIILQNVHVAQIESQRLHDRLNNEQLRIARMTRPSLLTRTANILGLMLIGLGQRLRAEPSTSPGIRQTGAPTARTV